MKDVEFVYFFLHHHLEQGIPCFFVFSFCLGTYPNLQYMQLLIMFVSEFNYFPMFSVEKGALVISLKLDNGHKLSCPWIDNACDEILAEFAPTPPQLLVDKFREHSCALLRLSAPQTISSSAIEYVRCHQLEEFLRQSPKLENGNGSANLSQIQFFVNDSDADSANCIIRFSTFPHLYLI